MFAGVAVVGMATEAKSSASEAEAIWVAEGVAIEGRTGECVVKGRSEVGTGREGELSEGSRTTSPRRAAAVGIS